VLAGPGVGQFFAELGARVIKVENLRTLGDVTRRWKSPGESTDDRSAYFCSVNWGKQSIAVDLSREEGQRIVHQLAAMSDIVIASYKPGDAEKLRVDYKTLSEKNPALLYGQITGYGSEDTRVGFDAVIQAESGFMSMNGEPGGRSLKIPVALMDVLAGHHLREGLLIAMLEQRHTGQGKLIEVSLMDAAIASLANQATNYLVAGKTPQKQGSAHPNIAPYGDIFTTADHKEVLLAVGTDRQFVALIEILGIESTADLKTNVDRVARRALLNDRLQSAIGAFHSEPLMARLHAARIPAGLIRTVPEALSDPQVHRLILSGGGLSSIRTVVGQGLTTLSHLSPPPHFGEHTLSLLKEMLRIGPTEAENLVSGGIVA